MRDEVAITCKLRKRRDSFAWGGGTDNVCLGNARELGDFGWNGAPRVYEGLERIDGFAPTHADGGNLEQRAAGGVESRGLGIEYDDLVLDEAKLKLVGSLGELTVHVGDIVISTRNEEFA